MTVCNMSVEAGARAGMVAPDETTFQYLEGRPFVPRGKDFQEAVERWKALVTDPGATYDVTVELDAAARVASALGAAAHVTAEIDLGMFGGSALTDDALAVPHHDSADDLGDAIPVTYVPARNTIFLSFALAWAETLGSSDIFIGVSALDYSGYPDCRPEYIAAYEQMAGLATKAGVEGRQQLKIHTPLIRLTKAETISRGLRLGVDYGLTHSCYDPAGARACGSCDSCLLRGRGFAELGLTDPALAVAG